MRVSNIFGSISGVNKDIYLEYKFGDYPRTTLEQLHATGWIVPIEQLTSERMTDLHGRLPVSIACRAFQGFSCPLEPNSQNALGVKLAQAARYNPARIIIDHLRFDGRWEAITDGQIPDTHQPCDHCRDVSRPEAIRQIAAFAREATPDEIPLGYFAVPLTETIPQLTTTADNLGQDHAALGRTLDTVSPMLYHRMIREPISYIGDYLLWLASLSEAEIRPILQTRDMPDDLADELGVEEMRAARQAALAASAQVVAWFSLDGAAEKLFDL